MASISVPTAALVPVPVKALHQIPLLDETPALKTLPVVAHKDTLEPSHAVDIEHALAITCTIELKLRLAMATWLAMQVK